MKSGGGIEFKPERVRDTTPDGRISDAERDAGLVNDDGTAITDLNQVTESTEVIFEGQTYKWKDIKDAVGASLRQHPVASGSNMSPEDVKTALRQTLLPTLLQKIEGQSAAVRNEERNLATAEAALQRENNQTNRQAVQTARERLDTARKDLDNMIAQARAIDRNNRTLNEYNSQTGRSPSQSNGGSGQFRAQTVAPQANTPAQSQGSGGANQPAPSAITSSPTAGAGAGYGPNMFAGMPNPTTAAYSNALAMDSNISDGIGMAGKARREGQRLMMLFFFFARMAESGDLGAMYQFIKFITYIIAKDKARQNIQIGSKLIQLQDLSRKATDALLATNADEKNMGEFMKAQQKAKSEVDTISTSQKLMADMLQEFAHVVESMVNSTKNLLDAWGRVLRTASSR